MSRINVVSAVDVLAVDGQPHAGQQLEHALGDLQRRGVVQLGRALVVRVGLGEHRDEHGYGAVVVMDAHDQENATENHEPERSKMIFQACTDNTKRISGLKS